MFESSINPFEVTMRKKLLTYLTTVLLAVMFISCTEEIQVKGKFNVTPEKPTISDEISVLYKPDSLMFNKVPELKLYVYMYDTDIINTLEIRLEKKGDSWIGKFKPVEKTLGILLKVKHKDEVDNNDKKGFVIHLYDKDGNMLPGSRAGLATAINSWGYYAEVDPDNEEAKELFTSEFRDNPETKNIFIDAYLKFISRTEKNSADSLIGIELAEFEKKSVTDEDGISALFTWYTKLKQTEKADSYLKILTEKYPQSKTLQTERFKQFRAEPDVNKKINLAVQFEKDFPGSEYIKTLYDLIANEYRDAKKYKEALEFLKSNKDKPSAYRFYAVANRMIEEGKLPEVAMEIAEIGVERNRAEVEHPTGEKPKYYSETDWKEEREYMFGLTLRALAKLQYDKGIKTEAEKNLREAVVLTQGKEAAINELYCRVLIDVGNSKTAVEEIEKHIRAGNGSVELKKLLKEAYTKEKGSDAGFDMYLSGFETEAKELMVEKLKKEMVKIAAPDFKLYDLDGKYVTLKEMKGKVVVLDFWATWCGPCLSSFPGMQKAVEKYSAEGKVKFLFINSWENVADKEQNAVDFIEKTKYPFRVLLDLDNKVIESYRVSGIPTKFIIDKEGNTRFISVGFSGNTDTMLDELSTMIGMLL